MHVLCFVCVCANDSVSFDFAVSVLSTLHTHAHMVLRLSGNPKPWLCSSCSLAARPKVMIHTTQQFKFSGLCTTLCTKLNTNLKTMDLPQVQYNRYNVKLRIVSLFCRVLKVLTVPDPTPRHTRTHSWLMINRVAVWGSSCS